MGRRGWGGGVGEEGCGEEGVGEEGGKEEGASEGALRQSMALTCIFSSWASEGSSEATPPFASRSSRLMALREIAGDADSITSAAKSSTCEIGAHRALREASTGS